MNYGLAFVHVLAVALLPFLIVGVVCCTFVKASKAVAAASLWCLATAHDNPPPIGVLLIFSLVYLIVFGMTLYLSKKGMEAK